MQNFGSNPYQNLYYQPALSQAYYGQRLNAMEQQYPQFAQQSINQQTPQNVQAIQAIAIAMSKAGKSAKGKK
jgi:hypothetical protein